MISHRRQLASSIWVTAPPSSDSLVDERAVVKVDRR
jgi:hypothetical protein